MQNLHITHFLKFSFFKNISDMPSYYRLILLKKLRHLRLRKPYCIILQFHVN